MFLSKLLHSGIYVYALVGESGTGKSFRAKLIAEKNGIDAIIDDGLLIKDDKILAGKTAKHEKTYMGAVSSSSQFALMSRFILLIVSKRALEKSSTLMYNLLRKVIGCVIRFALSKVKLQRIASSTLDGLGCYFFLL